MRGHFTWVEVLFPDDEDLNNKDTLNKSKSIPASGFSIVEGHYLSSSNFLAILKLDIDGKIFSIHDNKFILNGTYHILGFQTI